ncbi:hypothetical protein MKX01_019615 [Papaver californicum]|nr:hypothetical protein MKX01_019615 [Papaver californicum]
MESIWLIIIITLSFCATLKVLFNLLQTLKKLPPGHVSIPIITSLQWLQKSFSDLGPILRNLEAKYGPIITLSIGHRKSIFITTSSLAHQALIQNGAIFADCSPAPATLKIISSNQHNTTDASYESNSGQNHVLVVDHIQFGMFCLLVFMCIGEKLDEEKLEKLLKILDFFPKLIKIFSKKKWEDLRSDQEKVLIPLIRSRKKQMKKISEDKNHEKSLGLCYVDSLLNLELPNEGGRKLTEQEIVSLCSEFLDAATDTTSTALQWIQEEDLKKLPYLKAVILEGLRRHPPAHFILPHAVTQDIGLDGYVVPKEATVNVMIAEIGWDSKVWEDPMVFKPDRFLNEDGVLSEELSYLVEECHASSLAMLHLEYFVAIKEFKWTAKFRDDIDLS